MRLALRQVTPHKNHRRTGGGGKDDQACDIGFDLRFGQKRPKEIADEQPAKGGHRKRLYRPVDEKRDGNAAPMGADFPQSAKIDLQQHGHDHQPDQKRDGQIDLGKFHSAEGLKGRRKKIAKQDAGGDAERYPKTEIALKDAKRGFFNGFAGKIGFRGHGRMSSAGRLVLPIWSRSF